MTTYTSHDPRLATAAARSEESASYTDRRTHAGVSSGFGLGGIIGAGVVVLALIAYGGGWPRILTSIAVIAIGATLLFEAFGIGAGFRRAMHDGRGVRKAASGGALSVEFIGAAGAITLGILALINIAPIILMDIATIGYGAAFVLSTGGAFAFGDLAGPARRRDDMGIRSVVATYAAARPIAGMAAVILGILGLTDVGTPWRVMFTLVSLLAVGSAAVLGGLALGVGHSKVAA